MSGHSKWAGIKHKKALVDARRGKLFSKLSKEIAVAARQGGGDSDANHRLRLAVSHARDANMPSENIERAIKKGTGELPGTTYEELIYEGYGPGGVAILVEAMTDNKNRTTSDIRNIFSKRNGNLSGHGSVSWLFHKKGFILVNKSEVEEDNLMTIVLESGAEDMKAESDSFEITTSIEDFEKVKKSLEKNNIKLEAAELTMIPASTVKVGDERGARQMLALVEALEEHDDVQNVAANFDIPDEFLDKLK